LKFEFLNLCTHARGIVGAKFCPKFDKKNQDSPIFVKIEWSLMQGAKSQQVDLVVHD